MRKSLTAGLCVLALTACVGCTAEKPDDKPAADAWKDSYPECEAIWRVGEKLPADYEYGCIAGDSRVDVTHTACADGTRLFVHRTGDKNTHIAITGSQIRHYSVAAQVAAYDECLDP